MSDRREEHDDGGGFTVVLLGHRFVHPLTQFVAIVARVVVPGLVATKEGKDHVGFGDFKVGVWIYESAVARTLVDLVSTEPMVAEGQFFTGHAELGVGFDPAVVLHALCEGVAEQDDPLPVFYLEAASRLG